MRSEQPIYSAGTPLAEIAPWARGIAWEEWQLRQASRIVKELAHARPLLGANL